MEAAGRLTELTEQLKTDEELAAGYARAHEAFLAVRTCASQSLGDSQNISMVLVLEACLSV